MNGICHIDHKGLEDLIHLFGLVRQCLSCLIELIELPDITIELRGVKDVENRRTIYFCRSMILQEPCVLSIRKDHRQLHIILFDISQTVRYGPQCPVKLTEIVIEIDFLNGFGQITGIYRLRLGRTLHDRSTLGQILQICDSIIDKFVLLDDLQSELLLIRDSALIHDEALVIISHSFCHRHISDSHLGDTIVTENFVISLSESSNFPVLFIDHGLQLLDPGVLHQGNDQSDQSPA